MKVNVVYFFEFRKDVVVFFKSFFYEVVVFVYWGYGVVFFLFFDEEFFVFSVVENLVDFVYVFYDENVFII